MQYLEQGHFVHTHSLINSSVFNSYSLRSIVYSFTANFSVWSSTLKVHSAIVHLCNIRWEQPLCLYAGHHKAHILYNQWYTESVCACEHTCCLVRPCCSFSISAACFSLHKFNSFIIWKNYSKLTYTQHIVAAELFSQTIFSQLNLLSANLYQYTFVEID